LGDPAPLTYKFSRRGDCEIDQVVPYVLRTANPPGSTIAFEPYGYDERQLCSPGFNLPVGRLTRSVNGGYAQYHSSADDLNLITADRLESSLETCQRIVETLEGNQRYINLSPKGEPRLGKRGLYGAVGGRSPADRERAMLWVLNQSDGAASMLDIAERSGMRYADICVAADDLQAAGLLLSAEHPRRKRPAARPAASRRKSSMRASKGERK
jgi:aminopeptidase-like protein